MTLIENFIFVCRKSETLVVLKRDVYEVEISQVTGEKINAAHLLADQGFGMLWNSAPFRKFSNQIVPFKARNWLNQLHSLPIPEKSKNCEKRRADELISSMYELLKETEVDCTQVTLPRPDFTVLRENYMLNVFMRNLRVTYPNSGRCNENAEVQPCAVGINAKQDVNSETSEIQIESEIGWDFKSADDEEISLMQFPHEEIPLIQFSDEETPLMKFPDEEIPLIQFPDDEIPLIQFPDKENPLIQFPDVASDRSSNNFYKFSEGSVASSSSKLQYFGESPCSGEPSEIGWKFSSVSGDSKNSTSSRSTVTSAGSSIPVPHSEQHNHKYDNTVVNRVLNPIRVESDYVVTVSSAQYAGKRTCGSRRRRRDRKRLPKTSLANKTLVFCE